MYSIIEILRALAVAGLILATPPTVALVVCYATQDIDLHDSIRRLSTALLYRAADILRRPALQYVTDHLPINSASTTLAIAPSPATGRSEWFSDTERRGLRRLPRRGCGAHRSGTPARQLINELRSERLSREAATA